MQEDWLISSLKFIRLHLALVLILIGFLAVVVWGLYRVTHTFLTIENHESPTPIAEVTQPPEPSVAPSPSVVPVAPQVPHKPTKSVKPTSPATVTPSIAPSSSPPAPSEPVKQNQEKGKTYVVQLGDSTSSIARKLLGNGALYPEIEKKNNLRHNQRLTIGQVLEIPGEKDTQSQTKGSISSGISVEVQNGKLVDVTPPSKDHIYEVKAGDSLWKIAQEQLGDPYRWPEIYKNNKKVIGRNPNLIFPGQKLMMQSS